MGAVPGGERQDGARAEEDSALEGGEVAGDPGLSGGPDESGGGGGEAGLLENRVAGNARVERGVPAVGFWAQRTAGHAVAAAQEEGAVGEGRRGEEGPRGNGLRRSVPGARSSGRA